MPPMDTDRYRFGEFTLDVPRACLTRADAEVALRPKSFDLLHYLVTHAGRVVSKDELLGAIWPKVVVTEDSLTRCVFEVRAALGDGDHSMIKTLPKRGYLFANPVIQLASPALENQPPAAEQPATLSAPPTESPPESPPESPSVPALGVRGRWRHTKWLVFAGAIALACSVAVLLNREQAAPPKLSMLVFPFTNLNGESALDYLADTVTSDLTIALARLQGAMVIAPGSAFTLKGAKAEHQQIGAQFGVRYLVSGGVFRNHERVRVGARLVDTQNGATLWSDQFDVSRGDLLSAQDEIVLRLANALDAQLVQAASHRSPLAGASRDAEDLAMQCEGAWFRLGGDTADASFDQCEEALRLDPRNLRALVRLANYHATRVSRVQSADAATETAQAKDLAARALAVDPDYYAAHCAKADALVGEHRVHEALAAAERCLALNPSFAGAYRVLAACHFFLAEPNKSLEYIDRGIRISPRDPNMRAFLTFKGWAYFMLQRDEEALEGLRKAVAAAPENPPANAGLASILALTGHDADARAALNRYLALKHTRAKTIAQWNFNPQDNVGFRKFDERFKKGLRLAGMPER